MTHPPRHDTAVDAWRRYAAAAPCGVLVEGSSGDLVAINDQMRNVLPDDAAGDPTAALAEAAGVARRRIDEIRREREPAILAPVSYLPAGTADQAVHLWLLTQPERPATSMAEIIRIYEQLPEPFFALDHDWTIVYVNPVAEADRTDDYDTTVGLNLWDAFPELCDTPLYEACHRAARERVVTRAEHTTSDGKTYHALAYPVIDGLAILYRDITGERYAAEAQRVSEERFRALFEHAGVGMAILDQDGTITEANQALCALLGYPFTELKGRLFRALQLPHPEVETAAHPRPPVGVGSEPSQSEIRLERADGSDVIALETTAAVPGSGGALRQLIVQVQDLSTQHEAIESLRRSEKELLESFRRQREATERLRSLDEMKNTFLSAVSHDLRTPLTSVLGFAETLEQHADQLDEATRSEVVHGLTVNARRLARLLSDLLDLDRLQRGIVEPSTRARDLGRLVEDVIATCNLRDDHPLTIDVQPAVAEVDPAHVERIVENLVANAMRHTPAGTPVWVRVRDQEHEVQISVEDAGPGIPPEEREVIFAAFQRAPSNAAHSPGTGIGLSLVTRFATLHGGRAWAGERPGGGAAFHVALPKRATHQHVHTSPHRD